ncbi:MAG: UvrD-helicase domain-containing protein [Deferribacteres bacterium]|nr:UvrD-helicase domain-containing protein [candidate division KSB1 bacterium]MCB9503684.1 UvrD-helicase domain-containing protein [Deferribacteres bacterium]
MVSDQLDNLLNKLNSAQRSAVLAEDGPVLVLAGAGSGKTRVLTYRIAWLLANSKCNPHQIMAMTFTNKAAGEMKERLGTLGIGLGWDSWIGTFHSLGARILRREAEKLGRQRSFNIYDTQDQMSCIKLLMDELNINKERFKPATIQHYLSNAKNAFVGPQKYAQMAASDIEQATAEVYHKYLNFLRENNALDFDDLLMLPVVLFQEHEDVRERYVHQFKYLLVDEFQDTNLAQFEFIKLLAGNTKNVFVVGDDDQSIYRWRGADLRNILEFNKSFDHAQVFRLEQNYRSTKNILAAAHSVIVNNAGRHEKELWTEREPGAKIQILESGTDYEEAEFIVQKLKAAMDDYDAGLQDMALLYRTNFQSRALEDGLRRNGMPYIVIGGLRFYERKEIKDALAYLRVIMNPFDSISLRRIINFPKRAIGETTVQKLAQYALLKKCTLFEVLEFIEDIPEISAKARSGIRRFYLMMKNFMDTKGERQPVEFVRALIDESGMPKLYQDENTPESISRLENLRELVNGIREHFERNSDATLDTFLEEVALITDIDSLNEQEKAVTLMTLHAAKGLEYPVVFITGCEEGLFPLSRSIENRDDLEEERRLFYVGATRAQEMLFLSFCTFRRRFGDSRDSMPSRFLRELDQSLVEHQTMFHGFSRRPARRPLSRKRMEPHAQVMPDYEDFSQEHESHALKKGMQVQHAQFGPGVVKAIAGEGLKARVIVDFKSVGPKTLMVQYANLQKL